jgi:voltage-gated potassium channel
MVVMPSVPGALRTRSPEDERKLEAFEKRMALPILLSAVLPIILGFAGRDSIFANVVLVVTWFVFVLDYVVHLRFVPRYQRSGPGIFDLVVVLLTAPWFLIANLGASRFLAFARLARLARVLKASGKSLIRLAKQLGRVGLIAAMIVFVCAYVAYSAERSVNPEFATFGDAIWWAIVTITTVGYGDITPITTTGRFSATILMVSGIGLLGILAGSLASFFGFGDSEAESSPVPPDDAVPPAEPDLAAELARMRAKVAELDAALADLQDRAR